MPTVGLPSNQAGETPPNTVDIANATATPAGPQEPVDLAAILDALNRIRERNGVTDLVNSPDLARLAQDRSEELSLSHSLWHVDPLSGATPGERMAQAGFSGALAEHLIAIRVESEDPAGVVLQAWLTDLSHRHDVQDPQFALSGLGLSGDGQWWYLVQLLAERGPGP